MLILRTCNKDLRSRGGFQYPESGAVEAPDWRDDLDCGGGLHGLPWGVGSASYLSLFADAKWLVIEADETDVRMGSGDMTDKCKFRKGVVVYCGNRDGAIAYLDAHGCKDKPVVFAIRSGGDRSTVSGGDHSTVSGGDHSTVSGGNISTVSGGAYSTVSGGAYSTVSGGDRSTVSGWGHATVSGGNHSILNIYYWDSSRRRIATAYVGEDGIKPNTPYRLNRDTLKFEEVK